MGNLAKNLKKLINEACISERELSRRTGIVQSAINRIINDESVNPTLTTLSALSNYFLVTITELVGNLPEGNLKGRQSIEHLGWSNIPLVSKDQIYQWLIQKENLSKESLKFIPVDFEHTENTFAYEIEDDSMNPIFTHSEVVIVDPMKELKSGMYVLFEKKDSSQVQAGRLKKDIFGKYYIANLVEQNEFEIQYDSIFGVIIQSRKVIST